MPRSFLLEITLLSVFCVNVNNAGVCDCCRFGKEKKFIAEALGIKKGDIRVIKKFKGLKALHEFEPSEKLGEEIKNSHSISFFVLDVDDSGKPKEDDACVFLALVGKDKNINPSSELLEEVNDARVVYANNKGKKVKIIIVSKYGENKSKSYFCKKN